MKKLALAIIAVTLFLGIKSSYAQGYQHSIGVKLGTYSGITYKLNLTSSTAVEGVFTFGNNTLGVTGSYQKYFPIREVPGMNWYLGGGGHLIFISGYNSIWNDYHSYDEKYHDNNVALGVNGVAGLDYKFVQIPLNIGVEAGPYVNLFDDSRFSAHIGIFARYTF